MSVRFGVRLALTLVALSATFLSAQDSTRRAPRRQPVTPELERSAFKDSQARVLLERARIARFKQDSTLGAYDANTYMRMSVGMGVRRIGLEKLFFRTEQAARVKWSRRQGLVIQPTGRRTAFPMGDAQVDMAEATPIPFFPGRESLWSPGSGLTEVEVNEEELLHPLAEGAEAYYYFATGDSATIRLPDGRVVAIRELRITARKPDWRAFVGSFWFDVERGSLVRAAYRMSMEMDIWQVAKEENRRQIEDIETRLRADSGKKLDSLRDELRGARQDTRGQRIAGTIMTPMRANISAITVEYGLHQGRFWLPRLNVAEGEVQMTVLRIPMKVEERFSYHSVTVDTTASAIALAAAGGDTTDTTSIAYLARTDSGYSTGGGDVNFNLGSSPGTRARVRPSEDSLYRRNIFWADSLRKVADSLIANGGDTARINRLKERVRYRESRARTIKRRVDACARGDSTYYAGSTSRYDGALRLAIRMPCDTSGLATSPDLPASIYEEGERVFGESERDALIGALGWLQAAWDPRRPQFHTGLDMLRYNKIEGLSLGASLTSALGFGYTARLEGRFGASDQVPNGELSLTRSNGRHDVRLSAYHRLAVANDDFGSPLSFGASFTNLLNAGDEGFYYRSWGAELAGMRRAPLFGVPVSWTLFAEQQRSAGIAPNVQWSLGDLWGDPRFEPNIGAIRLHAAGARLEIAKGFGVNPLRPRLDTRLRLEGAATDRPKPATVGYGRYVGEGILTFPLYRFSLGLTAAAGTSSGELPIQRAFYVGGLHTVRGQFAKLDGPGRVGDAFWVSRNELGLTRSLAFKPTLFYDVGWAGSRRDLRNVGRPQSGAGIGLSMLDGLLRIDVARGIWPEKRWRTDVYLGSVF